MPIYRVPIVVSPAGGGGAGGGSSGVRDGTTIQHDDQSAANKQHRPTSMQVVMLPRDAGV